MKYIPDADRMIYDTNFDDEILNMEWKDSELENDDLKNYKAKAEYYVRQHQDNAVIAKLKTNIPSAVIMQRLRQWLRKKAKVEKRGHRQ